MKGMCFCALGLCMLASAGVSALEADTDRGQALYENHCTGCHDSQAHIRDGSKADSPEALREWIRRWQRSQALGWTGAEVADVAAFLDARFYKFKPSAAQ